MRTLFLHLVENVFYSGTVGAAMEAAINKVPSPFPPFFSPTGKGIRFEA